VNLAISQDEDFGLAEGNRMWKTDGPPFAVTPGNPASRGHLSLHQGGLVATPGGEWWGFSMMDANSVGRLTALSPVTWRDGWPYFGLPGNLGRTPRTWIKPATGHDSPPAAPYARDDDFAGPGLQPVWQWNHVPDDTRWSLAERPGYLRLHALPATGFWSARNTLTQRAVGPQSTATTVLEADGLLPGDVAGLALLNLPFAWIGLHRDAAGLWLEQFNQLTGQTTREPWAGGRIWLRAACDFLGETATFSFSRDGREFRPLGGEFALIFQLKTFQGVRFSLFAFNAGGAPGGAADFDAFTVTEAHPHGLMRSIPFSRSITLAVHQADVALGLQAVALTAVPVAKAARFTVVDCSLGRVALRADDGRLLAVTESGGQSRLVLTGEAVSAATTYQWTENVYGDLLLLSVATGRYVRVDPATGAITADHAGPAPDRHDGSGFDWQDQVR
jgi:hypothetical protein